MEGNNVTLEQALEAEQYVRSYIESLGGDVAEVMQRPNFAKNLPADVAKALETSNLFWNKMDQEGIIP